MRSFRLPLLLMIVLAMLAASGCRKKVKTAKPPRIGSAESGVASWYGHPYHGRRAANGEVYDMEKLTAAHRTLPFETWVRVQNLTNNKTVEVRIQDRGPFVNGRIIDLSRAAAREIDMLGPGIVKVRLTVIAPPKNIAKQPELFAVQVGAFRDKRRAEEVRQSMQEQYGSSRLVLRSGNPQVWRVLVGEESEQSGADALAERIRASGTSAFVVRLDTAEVGEPAP
jgi:rare lipoprotein A